MNENDFRDLGDLRALDLLEPTSMGQVGAFTTGCSPTCGCIGGSWDVSCLGRGSCDPTCFSK
jgi:hypothetical protein